MFPEQTKEEPSGYYDRYKKGGNQYGSDPGLNRSYNNFNENTASHDDQSHAANGGSHFGGAESFPEEGPGDTHDEPPHPEDGNSDQQQQEQQEVPPTQEFSFDCTDIHGRSTEDVLNEISEALEDAWNLDEAQRKPSVQR